MSDLISPETQDRYNRAKLRYLRLVTALAIITLALVLTGVARLNGVADSNRETVRVIRDCTDPQGQCFRDAAKRQAAIIGDPAAPINNVTILAAACGAANPGDVPRTRACVLRGLAR